MRYTSPDANPNCRCRREGALPVFCATGDLLECHYPFECMAAACNHLSSYDPDMDAGDMAGIEEIAADNIAGYAAGDCPECNGSGLLSVEEPLPEGVREFFQQLVAAEAFDGRLAFTSNQICGCVVRCWEAVER